MASELLAVDELTVRVVVDNTIEWFTPLPQGDTSMQHEVALQVANNPPLDPDSGLPIIDLPNYCCGAHGLSLLLTTKLNNQESTVLFDSGPEPHSFERNSKALKLDLAKVDRIVLSHWHSDHSGGILKALEMITQAKGNANTTSPTFVDLHPDRPLLRGIAPPPDFKPAFCLPKDPSFDAITAAGGAVDLHAEQHTVANRTIFVSGQIPRQTPFEVGLLGGVQLVKNGDSFEWDDRLGRWIMDERYAVVHVKGRGLVIFSSCSHAGIVNVVRDAVERFKKKVHMVIGGYHLAGSTELPRIEPTVDFFANKIKPRPDFLLPMHCTGFRAKVALANALGEGCVPAGSGHRIIVKAGAEEKIDEVRLLD